MNRRLLLIATSALTALVVTRAVRASYWAGYIDGQGNTIQSILGGPTGGIHRGEPPVSP